MSATPDSRSPVAQRPSWTSASLGALLGGITLGFIQVIIAVSFANLIFSGAAAEFLPYGIGAMLAGSTVTLIVVTLTTSAPGTASSIQDSPAVILAGVSASLVAALTVASNTAALLPTLLAATALSTLLTGATLWLLGHFRLGEVVRYIPYPVVGGFLAGTGLLLVIGGFTSMLSVPVILATLPDLFQPSQLILWVPSVIFALVMFFGMRLFKNVLALPGLILASIAVFYAVLFALGTTLPEASALGLLLGDVGSRPIFQPPVITAFAGVDWGVLLANSGGVVIIILLNLVSLLLNVSGIELILDREIDLNRELKSAGASNLLAGLAGGLSGYHTPTFTALSRRLSGAARGASLVAGVLCGLTLFLGAGFLPFIPKLILGGLLLFLGLDFMNEWVFEGWRRLNPLDYLVVISIMLVIGFVGFLWGVALGLLAMVTIFAVRYSRIGVLQSSVSGAEIHSNVVRPAAERQALEARSREIFVMELSGYIFFGTAYRLQQALRDRTSGSNQAAPRFVILDFHRVTGLDSSGVQIFRKIEAVAGIAGFQLIFSGLDSSLERSLKPSAGVRLFSALDFALEWCEEQLLGESLGAQRSYTLRDYLAGAGLGLEITPELMAFFTEVHIEEGDRLIQAGEDARELYFIQEGRVATYLETRTGEPLRVSVMGPGTIVGEIGLVLQQKRSASVIAENPTTAYRLTGGSLSRLRADKPALAAAFDAFIIRVLAERVLIASQRLENIDE